jgi:alpha-maltose-1-phosphate synthase
MGTTLARRFADETDGYLHYLTLVQAHVQVDIPAYARALGALIQNAESRRMMGAQALAHVRARFDWSAVVPQYVELARELAGRRAYGVATSPQLASGPMSPLEVDPFDLYADYPTALLTPDTPLAPGQRVTAEGLALLDRISGRDLYKRKPYAPQAVGKAMQALAEGGLTPAGLARKLGETVDFAMGLTLYLAKHDLVRLPQIAPRA